MSTPSTRFADRLVRDLRNPLGTIMMGAGEIARANLGDEPTRSAARIITTAEHMARMIDQLIDVTRMRTDGLELRRTSADLAAITALVTAEVESADPARCIELTTRGSALGAWDLVRVRQVLLNVIGNAALHGAADHLITVHVDGAQRHLIAIDVHNGGEMSVDPEAPFESYRRARREGTQGLGLGLFITREIVRAHGGDVSITSTRAEGTRVRVVLPRGESALLSAGCCSPARD